MPGNIGAPSAPKRAIHRRWHQSAAVAASGANLFVVKTKHSLRQMVGAGQKSGVYAALDPDTAKLWWATQVGPGSALGGIDWGSATDGEPVYVTIANLFGLPYASTNTGNAGSWSALDLKTGKLLWQVPDPNGAMALGPVTVANGILYAEPMAGAPEAHNMLVLSAKTGATLWSFAAGGSVVAGAPFVGDTVYWGSGYADLGMPGMRRDTVFYAFPQAHALVAGLGEKLITPCSQPAGL